MHQIYFDIIVEICGYLSCQEIVGFLNCSSKLRKHTDKVLAQIIKHRFQQHEANINNLITRNKNLITLYNALYNKYNYRSKYIRAKKNYMVTRNRLRND